MKFRVATYKYTLAMEADPIIHDGKECQALAENAGRRIRMSESIPAGERLTVLLHELRHCWGFHIPRPRTEEEECDLLAMIAETAYEDLENGGIKRLQQMTAATENLPYAEVKAADEIRKANSALGFRYVPASDLESWQSLAAPNGERVQCAACGTIVAGGSVVTDRHRFEDKAVGWVVSRTMFCGHCYHLQCWDEGATPAGLPNGSPMAQPVFKRGQEVDEFLAKHPQATGMIA